MYASVSACIRRCSIATFSSTRGDSSPAQSLKFRSESAASSVVANLVPVAFDLLPGRPVRGLIRWQSAIHRVDAERKQAIELRIERFPPGNSRVQKIPIERFQMPQVKDDAVPLRDGTLVQSIRADQFEELIRLPAGLRYSFQQPAANFDIFRCGNQERLPFKRKEA